MPRNPKKRGSIAKCTEAMSNLKIASSATDKDNDYYFESYARLDIHRAMLKDKVRTGAYKDAILLNRHLFKDKVVLDVGCGTGILSMFAARAGAAKVYAVERSNIIESTRQIIKDNKFGDIIHLIKGRIEQVELPVDKVDVIISEWMGYSLLFESMLDSVLFARDKWLKPGGLMFPDQCSLFIIGLKESKTQQNALQFWQDVYGLNMSQIRPYFVEQARFQVIDPTHILTEPFELKTIDLYTVKIEQLNFQAPFKLCMNYNFSLCALATFFSVKFRCCHVPIEMSTSPMSMQTHWKQTIFYLDDWITANTKECIYGMFSMKKNEVNPREIDVTIDLCYRGDYGDTKMNNLKYFIR